MDLDLKYEGYKVNNEPVRVPGSKSIAARALILNNITGNKVILENLPECDDTRELKNALDLLNRNKGKTEFYNLGSGGTSFRFFLAYVASIPGFEGILDCSEVLGKRPVSSLVNALREAGAEIEYLEKDGRPPLKVKGKILKSFTGTLDSSNSSQFASALMMASLLWDKRFLPGVNSMSVSRPYVEMTRKIIDKFDEFEKNGCPSGVIKYTIESDWSAASFFYELALLIPGLEVRLNGLSQIDNSLQGDSACVKIFDEIGVLTSFDDNGTAIIKADKNKVEYQASRQDGIVFNFTDTPDLVPLVVVGLCLSGIKFRICGIAHLKHKESDRLTSLAEDLAIAGYKLLKDSDSLSWNGDRIHAHRPLIFDSYGDHRIAMAMAISSVKLGQIVVRNAECVSKSFPDFFDKIRMMNIISNVIGA